MLWYKGWLETRFRLLYVLGMAVFVFVIQSRVGANPTSAKVLGRTVIFTAGLEVWLICIFLAGAGIATQPGLQAAKGLHGSTQYTLSLPVSRLRLLAVRAGLGWLEMAGAIGVICCLLWLLFPVIRSRTTPREMAEHAAVLIVCGSAFSCITVLLGTFLDDLWRMWGSFICYGAVWWLAYKIPAPASVNIFLAMGDGSPVLAHVMPWSAMAFAVGLAVVLLFASLKVVEAREY